MHTAPFAAPQDFKTALLFPEGSQACWFIFCGDQLLVGEDKSSLPTSPEVNLQCTLVLGSLNHTVFYAGEVADRNAPPPSGWLWRALRPLHTTLSEAQYALAGRAMQLIHWDRSTQFCGYCGNTTFPHERERCRECRACGKLFYPKLAPVILALILRGQQILLARSPTFPEPFYSAIAGFVEPGETLEQCVEREVYEEVGVRVKNIRYLGSQPWPFSSTLMVGFACEWQAGDIKIDPTEIETADWFELSQLPPLPPAYSLARILIDQLVQETEEP